jgi:hypothetical protein
MLWNFRQLLNDARAGSSVSADQGRGRRRPGQADGFSGRCSVLLAGIRLVEPSALGGDVSGVSGVSGVSDVSGLQFPTGPFSITFVPGIVTLERPAS